jgi:hypothetical protein
MANAPIDTSFPILGQSFPSPLENGIGSRGMTAAKVYKDKFAPAVP